VAAGGAFLILFVVVLAYLVGATLAVVLRGGRGPGDPPASHPRIDPAGFWR
jgi:hypothetical protein